MDNKEELAGVESTERQLSANVVFMWEGAPDWLGLNKKDIAALYAAVGTALDISPDTASKVHAYFGDHIVVTHPDGNVANSACCITDYDAYGNVEACRLVFNRSLELARYTIGILDTSQDTITSLTPALTEKTATQAEGVKCVFESPHEVLVWLMAEELGHAKIYLAAGSRQKNDDWQQKYLISLQRHGIDSSDSYRTSLQEVTTSRNVVRRVLPKFFPERAPYYKELYEQSLANQCQIVPDVTSVLENAYVKTGFDPQKMIP